MRWIARLVFWSTLVASPLMAQAGSPGDAAAPAGHPAASTPPPHLYFAPRPGQLDGASILTFDVRLDGKAYLQEVIFLDTAADEGNVFELLAKRPDLRRRLTRLAQNPANQLEVQLSADQTLIRKLSTYPSYLLYSQWLAANGVAPREASSLVLDSTVRGSGRHDVAAKGMQVDPACADQCSADYQFCVDDGGCEYGDCSRCQTQYDRCIYACPLVCVEPRSTSTSDTVQNWNGPTSTGNVGCYKTSFYSQGYYWYETVMERKHTTVTTTTHCDGTTSTSTSIWYDNLYCWSSTFSTCSFQNLWSPACHF